MPESSSRHDTILNRKRSVVLLVDVQERLMPVMADGDQFVDECVRVLRAATALGVPILCTEQYPKGLGKTVPALAELIEESPSIEKMTFSCLGAPELVKQIDALARDQVVVIGIESHVCVMQTALDLLAAGQEVHVPYDAVTSRSRIGRAMAIERMRQAGVIVTCVESVLFEWLVEAGTAEFKTVTKLLKREVKD